MWEECSAKKKLKGKDSITKLYDHLGPVPDFKQESYSENLGNRGRLYGFCNRSLFPQIEYVTREEILDSDAILIVTEWDEFNHLDYKGKIVIDGRRVAKAREARIYEGVCW